MDFNKLIGQIITKIEGAEKGSDSIKFVLDSGEVFNMLHRQDCCESVSVEEIDGNIQDLINTPILDASEEENHDYPPVLDNCDDSYTWTFYRIQTIKGLVVIRWYGTSNGYYSESVDFVRVN